MTSRDKGDSDGVPKILCFQHCMNGSHISCLEIPRVCPCCKENLTSAAFTIPPFSLPSPFTFANDDRQKFSCSLVIKPTFGDFLTTYKSGDDLHIGITDSTGKVLSYDEDGITECHIWDCCLLLKMITPQDHAFSKNWDAALQHHIALPKWQKHLYNTESHNCFSFVLDFLNSTSKAKYAKEEFCNKHIVPLTTRGGEYISVYRAVMKDGFYLH